MPKSLKISSFRQRLIQNPRQIRSLRLPSQVTQLESNASWSSDVVIAKADEGSLTGLDHSFRKRSFSLQSLFPFDHFSASLFGVPALLLLRMFYHAKPLATLCRIGPVIVIPNGPRDEATNCNVCHTTNSADVNPDASASKPLFESFKIHQTDEFIAYLRENPTISERVRVRSTTWVKALESTLSHEYLQVLVQDTVSGDVFRIVVDRSDAGDRVFTGWNWSSGLYASHHHVLPLPLLTLSFENASPIQSPSLLQFAEILDETSRLRSYRLLREMCWWYAEKVFLRTAMQYPAGTVHEWPFAELRYSFIVRSDWIRRPRLSKAAAEFHQMSIDEMRF